MEIEFRHISHAQTCVGNWRVRVAESGEVFHARNVEHCPKGEIWSAPYPAEPSHRLSAWERWRLWRKIPVEELFTLTEHITDPARATMGGSREEVELTDGARHHQIVVENTSNEAVTAVKEALQTYAQLGP